MSIDLDAIRKEYEEWSVTEHATGLTAAIARCYSRHYPALFAEIERLRARETDLGGAHKQRKYYQNLVYHACSVLDKWRKNKHGKGVVCGTAQSPTNEFQEQMDALLAEVERLRAGGAALRAMVKRAFDAGYLAHKTERPPDANPYVAWDYSDIRRELEKSA